MSEPLTPGGGSPLADMASVVNPMINPLQVKDSRWLTLEVCREFTRNKCTRSETDCKFAHPPPHVEVQNGRVTCCFDSIKGKCQRKDPPCKYLHPPQHLREQLLQNGRNNLILKNLQMQAMAAGLQPMVPGMMPAMVCETNGAKAVQYQPQSPVLQGQYPMMAHPGYIATMQSAYNPYMGMQVQGMGTMDNSSQQVPVISTMPQPKVARADRLEPTSCSQSNTEGTWTGSYVDSIAPSSQYSHVYFQPQVVEVLTSAGKKRPRDPSDDFILGMSMPGVIPMMKRPAMTDSKSGIPMYQPTGAASYQQAALAAMHLQQPFVPVTIAGHPPSVPRF